MSSLVNLIHIPSHTGLSTLDRRIAQASTHIAMECGVRVKANRALLALVLAGSSMQHVLSRTTRRSTLAHSRTHRDS